MNTRLPCILCWVSEIIQLGFKHEKLSLNRLKALRAGVRDSLNRPEISVIITRGACAMRVRKRANPRVVDTEKCNQVGVCLSLGCPAIQSDEGQLFIEPTLCAGDICTICEQLCPQKAIGT